MTLVDAFQQALAAEHRAVYLYEYAGGRASAYVGKGLAARCFTEWRHHQQLRSWLESQIARLGATPVAAELTYPAPDVTSARQVREVAQDAEQGCLVAWLAVVPVADPSSAHRDTALTNVSGAGVRAVSFGAEPQGLPGLRAAAEASPTPTSTPTTTPTRTVTVTPDVTPEVTGGSSSS